MATLVNSKIRANFVDFIVGGISIMWIVWNVIVKSSELVPLYKYYYNKYLSNTM